MSIETVAYLLPEALLIAVATLVIVGGAFTRSPRIWSWVALGGIVAAAALLVRQYYGMFLAPGGHVPLLVAPLEGPIAADLWGHYVRWLMLGVGALLVLTSFRPGRNMQFPEYLGCLLLAVAGLMIVAQARELIMLFVALELISIPTYVLLYLGRRDVASQEAAAKYFFLSILSSALLLYGFSFLYGMAGSTELIVIREAIAHSGEAGYALLARVALVLVLAGLSFRLAAVPFHFYAPDVYQGTTNANAGVLSVLPKVAGLVALVRIVAVAMPGMESVSWRVVLVISMLTMTLGNVLALWQDHLRRMLAYSSIAHAGYTLIGVAVGLAAPATSGPVDGLAAALLYVTVYSLAVVGAFAALTYLGSDEKSMDKVDDLAGIGKSQPVAAVLLAIFLFSLAGLPPLAGFWGKFQLFYGSVTLSLPGADLQPQARTWFLALSIVGVLNAATAATYYLRLIGAMFFRPLQNEPPALGGVGPRVAMILSGVLVLLVGFYPTWLVGGAVVAGRSVRTSAQAAVTPPTEAVPATAAQASASPVAPQQR